MPTERRAVGRPRIPEDVRRRVLVLRAAGKSFGAIAREVTAGGMWLSKSSAIRIVQQQGRESAAQGPVQNSSEAGARGRTRP